MNTERVAAASCALGMLTYTAIVGLLPAHDASGDPGGLTADTMVLRGVVRDFKREHADFNAFPPDGFGHAAGNLSPQLGWDWKPVFTGDGFRVEDQWLNRHNQPIAPHISERAPSDSIPLMSSPQISPLASLDTWSSAAGPYGGDNVGPAPGFEFGAAMPVTWQPVMEPSEGDLSSWPPGPILIDGDVHCDKLLIPAGRTVQIDGAVRILAEDNIIIGDGASIELLDGASLRVYLNRAFVVGDGGQVNANTHDPNRVRIFNLSNRAMHLAEDAALYARIVSPEGELAMAEGAHFYGTYVGLSLELADQSAFHLDMSPPLDGCGAAIEDAAGAAGAASLGGISSADTFAHWFNDHPGVNLSMPHTITLTRNDDGEYEYDTDEFHPIDGLLHGNEGDPHNYFFTYMIDAMFVYEACSGQHFSFEGDDDLWVFVDHQLVMDRGGVQPGMAQHLEIDRLGLRDGELYRFQIFHAQRQALSSRFKLKTTIEFMSQTHTVSLTGPFD